MTEGEKVRHLVITRRTPPCKCRHYGDVANICPEESTVVSEPRCVSEESQCNTSRCMLILEPGLFYSYTFCCVTAVG